MGDGIQLPKGGGKRPDYCPDGASYLGEREGNLELTEAEAQGKTRFIGQATARTS